MTTKPTYTPARRFPDFQNDGELEVKRLGEIVKEVDDKCSINELQIETYISTENMLQNLGGVKKTSKLPETGSFTRFQKGDILFSNIRPYLKKVWQADFDGAASNDVIVFRALNGFDFHFVSQIIKSDSFIAHAMAGAKGVKMPRGDKNIMMDYLVCIPSLAEQRRIATCLSALDEMLAATNGKLEQLKAYKKGLMQKLFPAKGKKLPELRFKEFEKDGEWEVKKYEDCLDYEQPQSYLVSSENYKKTGIPVLTAGKTFVLGFTDETFGVYTKLPVIIFDDFTTDCRYVDFPFKAKSSAMKMLSAKEGYDLRFVFATMQNNEFKAHDHQRHWISIYSKFKVEISSFAEQHKIAGCLASIDDMINQYINKVELLELYKKGLMQQMFPTSKR